MTTLFPSPVDVAAFRNDAKVFGIHLSSTTSVRLLRLVGDRRLAIDALLMDVRPEWLIKIVGEKEAVM